MIDLSKCYSCELFDSLGTIRDTFADAVYSKLTPEVAVLFPRIMLIYFLIVALLAVLKPSSFYKNLDGLMIKGIAMMAVNVALVGATYSPDVTSAGNNIVKEWIITPVEQIGTETGKLVLTTMGGEVGGGNKNAYTDIIQTVEKKMLKILDLCTNLVVVNGQYDIGLDMLGRLVLALLLAFPYVMVLSIFLGLFVESMFKFVAVQIMTPFLIMGLPFKPLRSLSMAGVRILAHAAVTIVLATAAMGFTTYATDIYTQRFESAVGAALETNESQRNQEAASYCRDKVGLLDPAELLRCQFEYRRQHMTKAEGANDFALSGDYFLLLCLGFASIIFHMQSKTMASAITGAKDGPGPVAATAAMGAVSALAGAGAKVWSAGKTATGAAAAGQRIMGSILGAGATSAPAHAQQLIEAFRGQAGNSFTEAAVGGIKSSPSGVQGAGSGSFLATPEGRQFQNMLNQHFDRQSKLFEQLLKGRP